MKLSESLMIASVVDHHPLSNESWQTCLVGMSLCAFGKPLEIGARYEAILRWPWLLDHVSDDKIPSCVEFAKNMDTRRDGFYLLTCLCNEVVKGRITFEQAVDAVRAIEPSEDSHEGMCVSWDRELCDMQVSKGEFTHV